MAEGPKKNPWDMTDLGNMLQNYGTTQYGMNAISSGASGNTKQALYNLGAAALARANPYAAGIMALTGGKSISQLLGKKRRPTVTGAQNQAELNRANAATRYENEMSRMASGAAADAAAFKEQQNAYRNEIRNIRERGIAARELGGYLGGTAAQTSAAGQAAMANLRANMARRGMTPSSGVYAGAEAALAGQVAGQQGAAIGALNRAAMDRAMMQQAQIFGTDVQQGEAALGRQASLLGAGAELAQRQQAFELQQLANQQARDQAMYQRRFGESQALGQGLMGAYNLYLQSQKPKTDLTTGVAETQQPAGQSRFAPVPSLSLGNRQVGLPENSSFGNFKPIQDIRSFDFGSIVEDAWRRQTGTLMDAPVGTRHTYLGASYIKMPSGWKVASEATAFQL